MNYDPQVNDYVIWNTRDHIHGWVYFKDKQYITIETQVYPKDDVNYSACCLHKNTRLLVVCFRNQWEELTYVKSRESAHAQDQDTI